MVPIEEDFFWKVIDKTNKFWKIDREIKIIL